MYEMYPDVWRDTTAPSQQAPVADRPRRRVRRAHPVAPPVLSARRSDGLGDRVADLDG